MTTDRIAGWYGKMPSLGDFASRRLPSAFIGCWDAWLQRVITASRELLGDTWLDAYLVCPVWRFVLFPGVCGETSWTGVMMPSVDRVGRYFPFTIAYTMPTLLDIERDFDALSEWLDSLESLALSTLDTAHDVQQFDDALLALRAPGFAAQRVALARRIVATLRNDDASLFTLPSDDEIAPTLMSAGAAVLHDELRGGSLWWTPGAPGVGTPLLVCRGLPDGSRFAAMLRTASTRIA